MRCDESHAKECMHINMLNALKHVFTSCGQERNWHARQVGEALDMVPSFAHSWRPREHFQATLYYCQQLTPVIILMRENISMCILLFPVLVTKQIWWPTSGLPVSSRVN